jgi:hypothetical protein
MKRMSAITNSLDVLLTKVFERFLTLLEMSNQLNNAEKKLKQKVILYLVFNTEVNAGLDKLEPNMISTERDLLLTAKTHLEVLGLTWSTKRR